MRLIIFTLMLCFLIGCEVNRTTKPNSTSVKVDIGKDGVNVDIEKK